MPRKHLSSQRAYHRKRRARLIESGLCINCGQVAPMQGYRRCLPCQEIARAAARAYMARHRAAWRAFGICTHCGQRQAIQARCWCGACAEAHTERKALSRARKKEAA